MHKSIRNQFASYFDYNIETLFQLVSITYKDSQRTVSKWPVKCVAKLLANFHAFSRNSVTACKLAKLTAKYRYFQTQLQFLFQFQFLAILKRNRVNENNSKTELRGQ